MGLQAALASFGGDLWRSYRAIAFWPYPAIVYRYPKRKTTWDDYRFVCSVLEPGDFILTTSEPYFLSNKAISGTAFKHLAVYIGAVAGTRDSENEFIIPRTNLPINYIHSGDNYRNGIFERCVCHAISEGVVIQDLGELLFHADYFVILRPWSTKQDQENIVSTVTKQVGLDYNFSFKPKTKIDSFYCTELGVFALNKITSILPSTVKINTSILGLFLPLARFKTDATLADSFLLGHRCVAKSVSVNFNFLRRSRFYNLLRPLMLAVPDATS